MKRSILCLVALFATAGFARADLLAVSGGTGDGVNVGSGTGIDQGTVFGGDGSGATLNGVSLPWLYCVDLTHTVTVGGNYSASIVLTNGTVNNGDGPYSGLVGGSTVAADRIAYLLLNFAGADQGNTLKQAELQSAIWTVEYGVGGNNVSGFGITSINGNSGTGSGTPIAAALALVSLADGAVTTGDRNLVRWLTPANSSDFDSNGNQIAFNQGLVTGLTTATPEPSTFLIAGLGSLGFMGYAARRRLCGYFRRKAS